MDAGSRGSRSFELYFQILLDAAVQMMQQYSVATTQRPQEAAAASNSNNTEVPEAETVQQQSQPGSSEAAGTSTEGTNKGSTEQTEVVETVKDKTSEAVANGMTDCENQNSTTPEEELRRRR